MAKGFLEVFPDLHMTTEMEELLKLVDVERVSSTRDRSSIRIYIVSQRLIHKKNIYDLEKGGQIPSAEKLERIAVYFAFRYLLKAVNDGDLLGRAQFCALGVLVTDRLSRFVGLPEALRLFSREIEHNEENLDTLLEQFWQTEGLSLSALLAAFGG